MGYGASEILIGVYADLVKAQIMIWEICQVKTALGQ